MRVRIEVPDGLEHEDHDLATAPVVGDHVWFSDEMTAVVTKRIWDLADDNTVDLIIVTTTAR